MHLFCVSLIRQLTQRISTTYSSAPGNGRRCHDRPRASWASLRADPASAGTASVLSIKGGNAHGPWILIHKHHTCTGLGFSVPRSGQHHTPPAVDTRTAQSEFPRSSGRPQIRRRPVKFTAARRSCSRSAPFPQVAPVGPTNSKCVRMTQLRGQRVSAVHGQL